jgi:hypothetical protein
VTTTSRPARDARLLQTGFGSTGSQCETPTKPQKLGTRAVYEDRTGLKFTLVGDQLGLVLNSPILTLFDVADLFDYLPSMKGGDLLFAKVIRMELAIMPVPLLALFLVVAPFAKISPVLAQECDTTVAQPRPISLGVSGSNLESIGGGACCARTLGSLVKVGGRRYILSDINTLATANGSQVVIQPGLLDLGCVQETSDQVADGVRFVAISKTSSNTVDAAIAKVIPGDVRRGGRILNIGRIAAGGAVAPGINMQVQKMGRSTCLTFGRITEVEVTALVNFTSNCNHIFSGTVTFKHQIRIGPGDFSADPGDDGSLVVTTGSCPGAVGLLFARGAESALASPMHAVLKKFKARMVGRSCTPTTTIGSAGPEPDLAAASQSFADSSSPEVEANEIAAVAAIKDRHEAELLGLRGVVGTGVGQSRDGGLVIRVFVEKDTPELRSAIPSSVETISTEIEETGPFTAD